MPKNYPSRNLPGEANAWGREVEERQQALEELLERQGLSLSNTRRAGGGTGEQISYLIDQLDQNSQDANEGISEAQRKPAGVGQIEILTNEGRFTDTGAESVITIGWFPVVYDNRGQDLTGVSYEVFLNDTPVGILDPFALPEVEDEENPPPVVEQVDPEVQFTFELVAPTGGPSYITVQPIGPNLNRGAKSEPTAVSGAYPPIPTIVPVAPFIESPSPGGVRVLFGWTFVQTDLTGLSYVTLERQVGSAWVVEGANLTEASEVAYVADPGSTETVRIRAFDRLGRLTGTSATASVVVSSVELVDLGSAIQDQLDDIQGAKDDAAAAQQAAADAEAMAQDAEDAALAAVGIAEGKGKVIIQSEAPAVEDRLPQNLWIDTTGGANTPKRWNGTTWVAVTDKAATDAASAAVTAQDRADAAFNAATAAATAAGNAQTSADSKNRVWYQTSPPAGTGHKEGDTWFDTDDGNKIHEWDGSAWIPVLFGEGAIADEAISADKISNAVNNTINTAFSQSNQAITDAATAQSTANGKNKVVRSTSDASSPGSYQTGDTWYKYSGSQVIAIWLHNGSAWVAQTLTDSVISNLNAGTITAGVLSADRIGANTVTAEKIAADAVTADKLAANSITAANGAIANLAVTEAKIANLAVTEGKIANLAVTNAKIANLDAAKITTGELNAARIGANSITASKMAILGDNAWLDPEWREASAQYGVWTPTINVGIEKNGTGSQSGTYVTWNDIPVETGMTYRLHVTRTNVAGSTGEASVHVQRLTSTKSLVGTTKVIAANAAGSYTGTIEATGVTTAFLRVGFYTESSMPTATRVRFSNFRIYQMATGSLIVDGAITADKIGANAVTTDNLQANAITSKHTITGALIRTAATGERFEINSQGITGIDAFGTTAFRLTPSSGALELTGGGATGAGVITLSAESTAGTRTQISTRTPKRNSSAYRANARLFSYEPTTLGQEFTSLDLSSSKSTLVLQSNHNSTLISSLIFGTGSTNASPQDMTIRAKDLEVSSSGNISFETGVSGGSISFSAPNFSVHPTGTIYSNGTQVSLNGHTHTGAEVSAATETARGTVERATQAEVNAGTDTSRYVSPSGLRNRNYAPYAMAAGRNTIPASETTITFPAGRFSQPPIVTATKEGLNNGGSAWPIISDGPNAPTTTSFKVRFFNVSGVATSGLLRWQAVQMTSTSANG